MCLYIGDVGDNRFVRKFVSIYKVQEPKNIIFGENFVANTSNWSVTHLNYPKQEIFNSESILIDVLTRELFVITKSLLPPWAKVFKTNLDQIPNTLNTLTDTDITLPLPYTTDATSSKDGQVIIIRLYLG